MQQGIQPQLEEFQFEEPRDTPTRIHEGVLEIPPHLKTFLPGEEITILSKGSMVAYMSDDFKKDFLKKIEEPFLNFRQRPEPSKICYGRLSHHTSEISFLRYFGRGAEYSGVAETTCHDFFYLFAKQSERCSSGPLLTTGFGNGFFIRNSKKELRFVVSRCLVEGWTFRSYPHEESGKNTDVRRIFRNGTRFDLPPSY